MIRLWLFSSLGILLERLWNVPLNWEIQLPRAYLLLKFFLSLLHINFSSSIFCVCILEKASIFKSALQPIKLTFRTIQNKDYAVSCCPLARVQILWLLHQYWWLLYQYWITNTVNNQKLGKMICRI